MAARHGERETKMDNMHNWKKRACGTGLALMLCGVAFARPHHPPVPPPHPEGAVEIRYLPSAHPATVIVINGPGGTLGPPPPPPAAAEALIDSSGTAAEEPEKYSSLLLLSALPPLAWGAFMWKRRKQKVEDQEFVPRRAD